MCMYLFPGDMFLPSIVGHYQPVAGDVVLKDLYFTQNRSGCIHDVRCAVVHGRHQGATVHNTTHCLHCDVVWPICQAQGGRQTGIGPGFPAEEGSVGVSRGDEVT